jgi:3-oxoacyl-[acyl-carrier-protein] synthase-3
MLLKVSRYSNLYTDRSPDGRDDMGFGLAAFGTALGEPVAVADVLADYTDDLERVAGYGYRTVHRAAPGVGVTDLALTAAQDALAAAGLEPGRLDLIVLGLTDLAEHLYWDPAASLQHRLGATNAEAVLVTQACTAGLAGLDLIAGRFATHPRYRNALLIGASRVCEPYWNRMAQQSMIFSDGAAAALAVREHPSVRWCASESLTDGRYADFYRLEVGGTARPFGPALAGEPQPQALDAWDIMDFFDYDGDRFGAFVQEINQRGRLVIERACERAGATLKDVRRVISLHDNRHSLTSLAAELDVPVSATNLELGLDTGHLGAADQIYSLAHEVRRGDLAPGDLVALVGLGRGMHWSCALMRM